jgi:hypothetical protein
MKKTFKRQQEETQKVWKNVPQENVFCPMKKWYGIIKVGDKSFITEYESKFRSEVEALFQEESRLMGGTLEVIGGYK